MSDTKTEACQFKVRLQQPLKEWLQKQANAAKRSLTAEIELRLEESRARQQALAEVNRPQ
ncbi:hypothetical protein AVHY2522_13655 [Acidovorax sp. SUPP2522]|uniref:Arc family DNA-binding protein n=1 Tax=unclassified Acidovorax TaxID=2684926 RepID=UPI002349812A|nr:MULTISPECIES: Arc family DNA-binding protein [unclassified Acidovorax]WCM96265.1 Arc family DNA-binding protein [Acidovorax sp. GBBC 1281]GKT16987.1 hypothetical protein AVHY2522_13655 [Acidovorax sp. SUPP2522]